MSTRSAGGRDVDFDQVSPTPTVGAGFLQLVDDGVECFGPVFLMRIWPLVMAPATR